MCQFLSCQSNVGNRPAWWKKQWVSQMIFTAYLLTSVGKNSNMKIMLEAVEACAAFKLLLGLPLILHAV